MPTGGIYKIRPQSLKINLSSFNSLSISPLPYLPNVLTTSPLQGFGSAIFFGVPDPGKNLHADPDPGGIWGRGLGVREKMIFFLSFFHVSDDS